MRPAIQSLVRKTNTNPPISHDSFSEYFNEISAPLPIEYADFLQHFNGCEGFIADEVYIELWSINELNENNEMYAVAEYAPEVFLIGSNGGDTAYGFIKEDGTFVQVPFIGMSLQEAEFLGKDFAAFIEKLENQ